MDKRLFGRLSKIEQHIDVLKKVESEFLYLEAHKKVMFSSLFLQAEGKNVAEKEANAYASADWVNFIDGHAEKEAEYNYMRRLYELKLKAYDAEHLTLKTETPVISRQGAIS